LSGNNLNIYLLSESVHDGVINLPIIKANFLDISLDLSLYDALIFSSKNAVYALENINPLWKKIPAFCIGEPTGKTVAKLEGNVQYVANSAYGNDFAKEIIPMLHGKKVAFLRARKVLSSLESILKNADIDLDSHVIYETLCQSYDMELEKDSVIIFTSPSTIECFFKSFYWDESFQAVCIGEVTAQSFPLDISLHVSKKQSIKECIELAKTLIKQN
jgi:uroporphyrinogen-III synthase